MKKNRDYCKYPNKISVELTLQHDPKYPNSAFMIFDFDPEAIFGSKGRVPVILTIDGKKFCRTLARYAGKYMMVFNKELREATGYRAGDKIQILLERDFEERVVEVPGDIQLVMQETGVLPAWEAQPYSSQKEHLAGILDARKEETKQRRIARLIEFLKKK